jgi:hypothetical protein
MHKMKLVRRAGAADGVYEITPGAAQEILDARQKNRPLREQRAARLARSINEGDWVTNGESLIFDDQERLVDGQHRCRAVVIANRPIVSYCVFGSWGKRAFDTIDMGIARTASDLIALDGRSHYTLAASTARLLLSYEAMVEADGKTLAPFERGALTPTGTRVKQYYERNRAEIDPAAEFVSLRKGLYKGRIATSICCFALLMARRRSVEKADLFFDRLATGENLTKSSPIWLLRNRVENQGRNRIGPDIQLAFVVKCWNAYILGRSITTLKFGVGEVLPRFIEKTTA